METSRAQHVSSYDLCNQACIRWMKPVVDGCQMLELVTVGEVLNCTETTHHSLMEGSLSCLCFSGFILKSSKATLPV